MSLPAELEKYLESLDLALMGLPVSARADIVTQIKNQVLETQKKDPATNLYKLLNSIGAPEQVANRYLLERGLNPQNLPKRKMRPLLKWMLILTFGFFALLFLAVGIVFWKFSPIVQMNSDSVGFLGGTFSLNDQDGFIQTHQVKGSMTVNPSVTKQIRIQFSNADLKLSTSVKSSLGWKCKLVGGNLSDLNSNSEILEINFTRSKGASCEFELPEHIAVFVEGSNGKIEVTEPRYPLEVKVGNGLVSLAPTKSQEYVYDLAVSNGDVDHFQSSSSPTATPIKIQITNGQIQHK